MAGSGVGAAAQATLSSHAEIIRNSRVLDRSGERDSAVMAPP
jgi:hypothetical protein